MAHMCTPCITRRIPRIAWRIPCITWRGSAAAVRGSALAQPKVLDMSPFLAWLSVAQRGSASWQGN